MGKVVKYRNYHAELRKINDKYRKNDTLYISNLNEVDLETEPIQLGINWASIGVVSVEEAKILCLH